MSERRPTDRELVERTLAGDRAAWAELYLRFRRLVVWQMARRLPSDDVDDAAQDFWARSRQVLRYWRPGENVTNFLTLRAWSHADRRTRLVGGCRGGRTPRREDEALQASLPAPAPRPDHVLETAELRANVRAAALSCAPTLRARSIVLRWLDVDEPTAQDLAGVLGITRQRIQQIEVQLLERLRPRLAPLAA